MITNDASVLDKGDNLPAYLFHEGTNYRSYDYLGAHRAGVSDGVYRYIFRVWAPNADVVSLTGDMCGWDDDVRMTRVNKGGVWECTVESGKSLEGCFYKYKITNNGVTHLKADPYAFYSETLEKTASILHELDGFEWNDGEWMTYRKNTVSPEQPVARGCIKPKQPHFYSAPLNIYEVHLGSWKTADGKSNKDGEHYLNYRQIADDLAPYVKKMGFTHVELMPIAEHPYDGSWGYQVCGFYSPTSRYGTPEDFMYFVDKLHSCGLGVILDWVPAHFPKDRHGLFEFDGQPLYEYQGKDRMEHKVWGTRFFDVGRNEIQSFLISNAMYWFREYHIDGLRIDAVASMLYLDFDREPGEWNPNVYGTNKNIEAIEFFKKLNSIVFAEFPDVIMAAEESTSWPMITKPVSEGGLGFNFKWNMGWANDMYEYVQCDPMWRGNEHTKLTFPMMYAFSENYILPVSHDEVVHGKKSLIDKMHGDYENKFATMRTFLTLMMTFPGKKLMFMGTEFAQFREWDYENQLEWFMLDYPKHAEMQRFVGELNNFYLQNKELWEIDDSWDGFEWIDADLTDMSVISYRRKAKDKSELIVALNFSALRYDSYKLKVLKRGKYEEIFATDMYKYGGGGILNGEPVRSVSDEKSGAQYIDITLPPLSGVIIKKLPGR